MFWKLINKYSVRNDGRLPYGARPLFLLPWVYGWYTWELAMGAFAWLGVAALPQAIRVMPLEWVFIFPKRRCREIMDRRL